MNFFNELCQNKILIAAILGWLIAQVLKVIFVRIKEKRFDLRRMIGSGGMPSSHSAFVIAMTTAVAFECGLSSPIFAVCVVVAFVVMYDASGVRRETGRQAEILNDIIENIGKDTPEVMGKRLKELIGHSPFEVAVGAILGFIIGFLFYI
ncbi:MAG: divergent PAP2 family protein [Ruminococcaceae bacterium]|nr:divergent PAP2 family protein [Oscillospiraceae bacterium]